MNSCSPTLHFPGDNASTANLDTDDDVLNRNFRQASKTQYATLADEEQAFLLADALDKNTELQIQISTLSKAKEEVVHTLDENTELEKQNSFLRVDKTNLESQLKTASATYKASILRLEAKTNKSDQEATALREKNHNLWDNNYHLHDINSKLEAKPPFVDEDTIMKLLREDARLRRSRSDCINSIQYESFMWGIKREKKSCREAEWRESMWNW
jgi:chaperonin cofactor prefoldin